MFYFDKKKEVQHHTLLKIRDEWGVLRFLPRVRCAPRLTDKELADQLGCEQATVERERKD